MVRLRSETSRKRRGGHAAVADLVGASIAGGVAANLVLDEIRRGVAHPDHIHAALMSVTTRHGPAAAVGFLRTVQKQIEAAG